MHTANGGCVDIEYLVLGMIQNNTYIVSDEKALFVVDPSSNVDAIRDAIGTRPLDAIVITHHHYDHIGAAYALREATGAPVIASAIDAPSIDGSNYADPDRSRAKPCPVDQTVADGDIVEIGAMAWKVILTPGHTPGGICLFLDPQFGNHTSGAPVLISGDTLFAGAIGRTDFEGGSIDQMRASLKRLAILPDNTLVLPGHNDLTTIGAERTRVFARFAQ